MVSLKFSSLIDAQKTVILFDAYKDDLHDFEKKMNSSYEVAPIEPIIIKPKKQKEAELDPDRLVLQDDSTEEDSEQEDVMSDASSIESLDLEDDEMDLQQVKPPLYVQSLLQYLRVNTDEENAVEMLHTGLRHATALIRKTAQDEHQRGNLEMVSVALARAFIYMEGDFGLQEFPALQYSGLVSLVVTVPEKVVKFLTNEFYSQNVTVSHRALIIDAIKEGALELSNVCLMRKY
jgi:hypothetical protein